MTRNLSLCFQRPSAPVVSAEKAVIAASEIPAQLDLNTIVIKVDRFGFSANNVTYQALGEEPHFRYFDFHPSPETREVSPKTHGLVPVWGFGTVVASSHPKILAGERVYGYLAPSRYLVVPVSPADVNKHAFYVPRPHLPADGQYNQIIRCAADPEYTPTPLGEDLTMLYRPLFWTAYWFEDWIFSLGYRGATAFLISSASAKTAFCAAARETKVKIIGLTSKRNVAFTKGLGLYDAVLEYDSFLPSLGREKWVYVDVAGNDELNKRVFAHFQPGANSGELVSSVSLGMTTMTPASEKASRIKGLEQFFMPEWLNVRKHQLSLKEIFRRQKEAWAALMVDCVPWVRLVHVSGAEQVKKAYDDITRGGFSPEVGYIWSLWDEEGVVAKL
ncbi:hypothetical protein C8R46DRAFT_1291474 [Mycena filopes]|nr:hypothetical protein C8R46DRAFT_1291474 [Mycena filopes]